jgi:hypothetical protein
LDETLDPTISFTFSSDGGKLFPFFGLEILEQSRQLFKKRHRIRLFTVKNDNFVSGFKRLYDGMTS